MGHLPCSAGVKCFNGIHITGREIRLYKPRSAGETRDSKTLQHIIAMMAPFNYAPRCLRYDATITRNWTRQNFFATRSSGGTSLKNVWSI